MHRSRQRVKSVAINMQAVRRALLYSLMPIYGAQRIDLTLRHRRSDLGSRRQFKPTAHPDIAVRQQTTTATDTDTSFPTVPEGFPA